MNQNFKEKRRKDILETYVSIKPLAQFVGSRLNHKRGVMLDVGTGEGIIAVEVAKEFAVSKAILTDVKDDLLVNLPENTSFQLIDVCASDFVNEFQNKVTVVTCFKAFHEFSRPFQAAVNLVAVLPNKGTTFILDHTEEGWNHVRRISMGEGMGSMLHYEQDRERMRGNGLQLDTDRGIRAFWEKSFFPRVPGECRLNFHGDMYSVVYIARQWGEVKPFPG